ncbi:MAG: hypothetical protein EPO06_03150 [Burkholderiaceae bacterium]|nr:MAG: hypothetical protein EPO06_03150 [Burkholderiaceae bacterium]
MKSNLIGMVAWALLALVGLVSVVDLGFGPIVICPACSKQLNMVVGIVLIAVAVVAIATNRKAAGR